MKRNWKSGRTALPLTPKGEPYWLLRNPNLEDRYRCSLGSLLGVRGVVAWLAALLLLIFAACKDGKTDHPQHGGNATAYQCPMKCEGDKTYPQPGTCPVCKMDLKPVEMTDGHDHSAMQHDTAAAVYTCPMHPEIVRDEPGSCPF